jgi:hypothetical protein
LAKQPLSRKTGADLNGHDRAKRYGATLTFDPALVARPSELSPMIVGVTKISSSESSSFLT